MTAWQDPPFERERLIEAARGERELDLVLRNVQFVNVFTGEVYPADIGVFGGRIAHVEPSAGTLAGREVLDRTGLYAVPGLIDTHVHIESSMVGPAAYAEAVLPHGTTTVLIDPHELANVNGLEGVRYMLDASEGIPLRVLVMAPSCVPSAPSVETAGASFDADEIAEMLTWPRVVGLAEVMDYPGVLNRSGRMMRLLDAAAASGGIVQGHAPLVRGRDLSAYAAAGIDSDHETQRPDEALDKLRAGLYLEARESSLSFHAAAAAGALRGLGYLPNVTLCSDDVTPEDLLRNGHIDHVARRLVEEGLDPVDVVRFATLNASLRLRRNDLGALAPGRIADIALLSDLPRFAVAETYRAGRPVARDGAAVTPRRAHAPLPYEQRNTVLLPERLDADAFRLRPPGLDDATRATIRTIDFRHGGSPRTVYGELAVDVEQGELVVPAADGDRTVNTLAVVDRHRVHGGITTALVRGFGLRTGALASTVSHDCHQLTVLGCDRDDMLAACRALEESAGGIVLVRDGAVAALIRLPVAGLISTDSAEAVAAEVARFRERMPEVGLPATNAFMGIVSLTLAVSPEGKLSDLGLVDVARQTLLPLVLGA